MAKPAFDVQAFLEEQGRPAQVASVSGAGVPILGSLWFVFESGRFWFSSLAGSPLPLAAARGALIAVIVDDFTPPSIRQVRTRGPGQVEPYDSDTVHRIYSRYLGPEVALWPDFFRARASASDRWVLWSARPDSGLAVTSPGFSAQEARWSRPEDSPWLLESNP